MNKMVKIAFGVYTIALMIFGIYGIISMLFVW